ncbi:MAG: ABC transporter family substrate-binding protein [Gaiellaceae bacterium]
MARPLALAAAIAVALLAVSGAGRAGAQTPTRGGTLVIGTRTASEPACLNVLIRDCHLPMREEVLPGAFEVQPDATFRPDLADAEIVAKQPLTLVYHIRPEARWSDGVAVSAEDFVFTHRAILKNVTPDPNFNLTHDVTKVRSVRQLDKKTVKVVLRARYVDWRLLFDVVLPRHALAGESFKTLWRDGIDNPKTRRAIGSGPFLVDRWDRGRHLILRRNPRYWGPHAAYLDRILYRFLPAEDTGDALRSGDIDMIEPGTQILQAQALELHGEPGYSVLPVLGRAYENIIIRQDRGGNSALTKKLVRQALAFGIDRVEIARRAGELTLASSALKPLHSVVFLASSPYYRANWRSYRYRPARARQLLEQAGCRTGADGIYVCDRNRLSLRFAAPGGIVRRELTVRLAQAQLREVGVEVVPEFRAPSVHFGQILPSGDFDLFLGGWILGASTDTASDLFRCGGGSNYTGYCDRLITRDLVQVTKILDESRRVELLNKIDARLAKAVPELPLFQATWPFAFKAAIRGVVRNGAGSFTWNAENWWLDR